MRKYLRNAVTALSLTACVLLIVLWVRSYWWITEFGKDISVNTCVYCATAEGIIQFTWMNDPLLYRKGWYADDTWIEDFNRMAYGSAEAPTAPSVLPVFGFGPNHVAIPIWLLLLVSAAFAIAPWIEWSRRFSLRTLLIATTLVAVVLGSIVATR
jgi:hypothetical protein